MLNIKLSKLQSLLIYFNMSLVKLNYFTKKKKSVKIEKLNDPVTNLQAIAVWQMTLVIFEIVILNIWSSNRRNSNKRYKHFLALNLFHIYSVPRTRLKEILGFWYRSFGQNFSWLMTWRSFYLDSTCFLLCDFLSSSPVKTICW